MPQIAQAVRILRSGGLVAFPTETVYGLGADATSSDAIRKVFAAKGRPNTNPLIVHVADASVARRYTTHWPDTAGQLTRRFWPGPLTLVLPKNPSIVSEATAGKDTVGLRAPDHPLTLELLRQFDGPLAGPSANRSNRVSPTTAEHVLRQLGDRVDLILDGGPCRVGIESTVLDLSRPRPIIPRPGQVSREQIEHLIGPVDLFSGQVSAKTAAASPGQQALHYSPATPAYRFDADRRSVLLSQWCQEHPASPAVIVIVGSLAPGNPLAACGGPHRHIPMPTDPAAYARQLYAVLHEADTGKVEAIWIEMPPEEPAWLAVRDRLRRATRPFAFS